MTPRALIVRALKKSGVNGVGQTPNATDLQDALDDLNDMFAQWERRRWLVTDLVEVVFSATGQQGYKIGPDVTNDIIMARPDRISDAFLRLSPDSALPIDYPLDVIEAREDYNEIAVKGLQGPTSCVFYDAAFPSGTVYIWPTPPANGSTEIHLFSKNQEFLQLGLDNNISLPPEYSEAILYNLAARLRPAYQLPPDASLIALAKSSLATVRKANAQVPVLDMPDDLPGQHLRGGFGLLGIVQGGGGAGGVFRVDISTTDGQDVLT